MNKKTMNTTRNNALQALCRDYLIKLRPIAAKFGLGSFVDETIELNRQDKCRGTKEECELLSRAVDDERLTRIEVAKVLGKSYRQANEKNLFDRVKKLHHRGIYSKVGAILLGSELKALYDGD